MFHATQRDLAAAGVLETWRGAVALRLALLIDSAADNPQLARSLAPLCREHRVCMAVAMEHARPAGQRHVVAELRARRDAKRAGRIGQPPFSLPACRPLPRRGCRLVVGSGCCPVPTGRSGQARRRC